MAVNMNFREQNFEEMNPRLGNKDRVIAWNMNTNRQANNTFIVRDGDTITLEFHGYVIARFWQDGTIAISNAGYASATTKHRLNGFNWLSVWQKNHSWYFSAKGCEGDFEFEMFNIIFADKSVQTVWGYSWEAL